MPRIPIYNQQTTLPTAAPLHAQAVDTPDYIGQGVSALGRGVENLAESRFRVAVMQKNENERRAREAAAEAEKQKRGKDAIAVAAAESEWNIRVSERHAASTDPATLPQTLADAMAEESAKLLPALENEEQRRGFSLVVQRNRDRWLIPAIGQAQVARRQQTVQEGATAIDNNVRFVAMSPDVASLRENFADRLDKSLQVVRNLPLDPATKASEGVKMVEKSAMAYADRLIELDPYAALNELNEVESIAGKNLDPQRLDDYRRAAKHAIQAIENAQARQAEARDKSTDLAIKEAEESRRQGVMLPLKGFNDLRQQAGQVLDPAERTSALNRVNALQLGQDAETAMAGVPAAEIDKWRMDGMPMGKMPVVEKGALTYINASTYIPSALDNKVAYAVLSESANRLATYQRSKPVEYIQSQLSPELAKNLKAVAGYAVNMQRANGVKPESIKVVSDVMAETFSQAIAAPAAGQSRIVNLNAAAQAVGTENAPYLFRQLFPANPGAAAGLRVLVGEQFDRVNEDTAGFLLTPPSTEMLPEDGDDAYSEVKAQVGSLIRPFLNSFPGSAGGKEARDIYNNFAATLTRNMYAHKRPAEEIVARIKHYTTDRYDISSDQQQAGTALSVGKQFGVSADDVVEVGREMFDGLLLDDDLADRPTLYTREDFRAVNRHNLVIRRVNEDTFQYMVTDGLSEWPVRRIPAGGKKPDTVMFTINDVKAHIARKKSEANRIRESPFGLH